jgi:hypothetical protein
VSNKEGTFTKELGHKSQGNFFLCFWAKLFFCCGRLYCTDPYSVYNFVHFLQIWHKIEAVLDMIFEVDFQILFIVSGSYGTICTTDCWHENRGTEQVLQHYGFGTENEAEFGGTVLLKKECLTLS